MPITTKPQLATAAAGAALIDLAQATRVADDVVSNAKVITNNGQFDEYEVKAALKGQSSAIKALVMSAYNSAKNDADAKGVPVKRYDVTKKLEAALASATKADKNGDGELSEKELGKLQNWTPLRLAMAAVSLPELPTGKMSSGEFAKAATDIMKGVLVMSEGDSPLTGVVTAKTSAGITPDNVLKLFKKVLDKEYGEYPPEFGLTAEVSTTAKAKKLLNEAAKADPEADDATEAQLDAAAYANLKKLFAANLTDVRFVRIGEKEEDGSMGVDRGTYVEMFVGKTADGKLGGVMWTSAET